MTGPYRKTKPTTCALCGTGILNECMEVAGTIFCVHEFCAGNLSKQLANLNQRRASEKRMRASFKPVKKARLRMSPWYYTFWILYGVTILLISYVAARGL